MVGTVSKRATRLLLVFAFIAPAATLMQPAAAAARPNIVLIVTDDQRWDTVSAMPRVRRLLSDHGVTFSNAIVANPLCCPSRASILTGRYSHSTRVYRNIPPLGGFASFRDGSTIATWLRTAGYHTAFVGKYLNGYVSNAYVPPGWDRWFAFSNLGYYRYGLNIDGKLQSNRTRAIYSTDRLAAEAIRFIRTTRAPFFLYLAPHAPHIPATPAWRHADVFSDLEPWRPPSYRETDVSDKPAWLRAVPLLAARGGRVRRAQLQSLLAVDEAVGRIVTALARMGYLRNTLVVFTSDNGYLWGEHRLGGKRAPYRESIRVPLVVRYDRLITPARVEPRLVSNIDLAPTFARLAGRRAPGAEGRSLLPLLAGGPTRWRNRLLVENLRQKGHRVPTYCGLVTRRTSYVMYSTGEQELYDHANDPYELDNLARDPASAGTVVTLRAQLGRLCNPPPPGLGRRLLCTMAGTSGADLLRGTRRYDIVCARGGDDRIDPAQGRDWVFGARGNDRLLLHDGFRDVARCGEGLDSVVADARDLTIGCEVVRRP